MEFFKFKEYNDESDLKKEFKSIKNLKLEIEKSFGRESLELIRFKSWKSAYIGIMNLVKILERERLIIGLTEVDNPNRFKIIGLNTIDIENSKAIKTWYRNTSKLIHPDYNNNSTDCENAMAKLNFIYEELKRYE